MYVPWCNGKIISCCTEKYALSVQLKLSQQEKVRVRVNCLPYIISENPSKSKASIQNILR